MRILPISAAVVAVAATLFVAYRANEAVAFYNRGNAYAAKAQYDRAIEDFDQAIGLDPKYALAFYSRGVAYAAKAQYDRAIEDFDQAIRLAPKDALAIYSRGIAYFNKGRFAVAARDFEQSLSINAAQAYGVLWLHLARARSDRDDTAELTGNAVKLDLKTWPGPVVAFYLKGIDANGVMAAARACDDDDGAHPSLPGGRGQRAEGHRQHRRPGEAPPR
jgi:lipoprotein NlpI